MTLPKISIVTPSYNQGAFLESTIQSVISQQYPNLEYMVIDGGSTDESPAIIDKYREHLAFACSEPDGGHIPAINKGFSHATGDIMAWINSDDMYFPWTLRTVASIMTALPDIEWLTTMRPAYLDYQGFCFDVGHALPGFSKEAFLDGCYVSYNPERRGDALSLYGTLQQESTFWRRSLWERAGATVRTEFKLAADFDLWARFYEHAELYGTTAPLAGFRHQFTQKSADRDAYLTDCLRSLQQLRERSGWKPDGFRRTALNLRLDEIPLLRRYVFRRCRYTTKVVIRNHFNRPDTTWGLADDSFFRRV